MDYKELLDAVMCRCVIIIEDDFKACDYRKEKTIYDFTRMDLSERGRYLSEVNESYPALAEQLSMYLSLVDQHFDDIGKWEDTIPRGDILPLFSILGKLDPDLESSSKAAYDTIDEEQLQEAHHIGLKYGIGVNHPACFNPLFDDYLLSENRAKPIRVYTNFSADTKNLFENDLKLASEDGSLVCIIDNNLDGNNRAQEIVNIISETSKNERKNVIGSIFSSKEKFEQINNSLYFEFTSKESPEKLKECIAKSAYNYFISKLKKETLFTLDTAFTHAVTNKGIAYYLSQKAKKEGSSEYQIITDWIRLMSTPRKENSNTIKNLITLSRVINSLEDIEDLQDAELENFNTLEVFDHTVNDYFSPAMPGDVFTNSRGEWFVLIGQDCDMMRRGDGNAPKNTVAELLPAKIFPQTNIEKIACDLEKVAISNFKKSPQSASEILQILYKSRKFVSNEILNLCTFANDGVCRLSLSSKLSVEAQRLLPKHLISYYDNLQKYYKSIISLQEKAPEDFKEVIVQAFSPRAISLDEFTCEGEVINFDLKRVCRLSHVYVYYLYKLYLEYRGRQPFESINLVQNTQLSWPVTKCGEKTGVYLNFLCTLPAVDSKIHKMKWSVDSCEINRVLEAIGIDCRCEEDIQLNEIEETITLNGGNIKIKKFSQYKVDIKLI